MVNIGCDVFASSSNNDHRSQPQLSLLSTNNFGSFYQLPACIIILIYLRFREFNN